MSSKPLVLDSQSPALALEEMPSISRASTGIHVLPQSCTNEDNVTNGNGQSKALMDDSSGVASCCFENKEIFPEVAIPGSRSNIETIASKNPALPVSETVNNKVETTANCDSLPSPCAEWTTSILGSSRTGSVASASATSYNTARPSQNYQQNCYRPQYRRRNGFNMRGGYREGRGFQNRNHLNTNHSRGRFNNWNPNTGFYGAVNFNGPVRFSQPPPMHWNPNLPRVVNPGLQQHEHLNAPNTGFNAGLVNFAPHQHENFDPAWFSQPPPMHWNPNLQQRERFNGPYGFSAPPPMPHWFPTGPSDVSDRFSCPPTAMPPHPSPRSGASAQFQGPYVPVMREESPYFRPRSPYISSSSSHQSQLPKQSLPSEAEVRNAILKHIEYYFSKENLVKDLYLRSKMDEEGWVSVDIIATFRKMQFWAHGDTKLILNTVQQSEVVEAEGDKMRKRGDWMKWICPQPSSSSCLEDKLLKGMQNIGLEKDD